MAQSTENKLQLQRLESENKSLKLDIKDLKRSRNELNEEVDNLHKEKEDREKSDSRSNNDNVISGLETELKTTKEEIGNLKRHQQELEEGKTKLDIEHENLVHQYVVLELELKNLKADKDKLRKEAPEKVNSNIHTTTWSLREEEIKKRQDELTDIFAFPAQQKGNSEENTELKREISELQVKLKGLNAKLELQKSDYGDLNHALQRAREELERKKNDLKIEKSTTNTFRQLIEELNRKIEELKNSKVPDKTIQEKTNIQSPILNEEMIEKIDFEKTGLESQVREQIEEIKSLNSQINLTKEQFESISIEKFTQKKENEERLQQELDKLEREELFQNKEQEKQIIDLKTSLEQSGREIIEKERHIQEIEGVKLRIETELNRVRSEFKEKTESSETYKSKIEKLTKANSELEMSVQISNEKNKKYKHEHSKVTLELQDANTKHLEMQQTFERTILEANKSGNESKQKQETELKTLKDQNQLLTQQNNEHRETKTQCKHELLIMDGVNQENKQAREELEVKLKGLNEELEQQKSDYEDLNHELQKTREELEWKKNVFEVITMESTKDKGNMQDKYFQMEKEKQDLQEQIKGLHTLINTLQKNTGDVKFKLDEVEKEKDKNKTEKNKFEKQLTDERIQKEEGRNSIEKLEIELKGERESLEIHKQLIRKLNEDIKNQATGQTIIKVREELEQANEFKSKFEDKLREMSKEIADRDAKIQQLYKKIGNIQVDTHFPETDIPQSYSDSNLDRNVFSVQSEKGQAKVGVTKLSADKPQGAEGGNQITPIPNPTGRSSVKIKYKSVNIHVVKLKVLPDPTKHVRKQIVCTVKRNLELGTLVGIFEVKIGRKTVKTWYVGIRLNEPLGDSDGAFQGIQRFKCEPNHGYFSPFEDIYVPVL